MKLIPILNKLYVLDLCGSLFSMKHATNKGLLVPFNRNNCFIKKGKDVLTTAKIDGDLYKLVLSAEDAKASKQEVHDICLYKSNCRMGHRFPDATKELLKKQLTRCLELSTCSTLMKCIICIKAKATHKLSSKVSENRASAALELAHSDMCKPVSTLTARGNKYFLTFIDDFSHFSMAYLLKSEAELFEKLKDCVTFTSKKFQRKVQVLRTDKSEFTGHNIKQENDIQHQTTALYMPSQNGITERKHHSLMEMSMSMLIDAAVSRKFWGEAMNAANHLQKRKQ